MSVDPIADFLTRVRNGLQGGVLQVGTILYLPAAAGGA